jgi:hypothetical protein
LDEKDTYIDRVIEAIKQAMWRAKLDGNPTVMDGHPNTLILQDAETGILYTVTVEEG